MGRSAAGSLAFDARTKSAKPWAAVDAPGRACGMHNATPMPISRVLLVDDEEDIRLVAGMSLKKLTRWEVRAVASGREALDLVPAYRPDLILLDVMMPDLDGPETLRELRSRGIILPVIFLTAKVQRSELDRLMAMGARGIIAKPFDPLTLGRQVQALVEGGAVRE